MESAIVDVIRNELIPTIQEEHQMDREHHGITIGFLDEAQLDRHTNLLVFLQHLESSAQDFQRRMDINRNYPGIPDPSDSAYGIKNGKAPISTTFCSRGTSAASASEGAASVNEAGRSVAESVALHTREPEPEARAMAITATMHDSLLDLELVAPTGNTQLIENEEHALKQINRLVDWRPVRVLTSDTIQSAVDVEVGSMIKERHFRQEPIAKYLQSTHQKTFPTQPLDEGMNDMLSKMEYPGKEALLEAAQRNGDLVSERSRLDVEVYYRSNSVDYLADIQAMGEKDLLVELITTTNLQNRLMLEMLNEQEQVNRIVASRTAQEVDLDTRKAISDMRVRSATFKVPSSDTGE
ncbi:hypothetical protein [Marinobacterium sp. BA1]|uniref:hypothetical protein n=1 Tax=Marinobacterium sp. BA1 TaxID=3138931 RepID=UPI0034E879FC